MNRTLEFKWQKSQFFIKLYSHIYVPFQPLCNALAHDTLRLLDIFFESSCIANLLQYYHHKEPVNFIAQ